MSRRRPIRSTIRTHSEEQETGEGPSPDTLREAYAHWASGVAVLAARSGGILDAMTVTAFTPVSVEPPLVLVCVHEFAQPLSIIQAEGRFTVSVLPTDAQRTASMVADRFLLSRLPFAPDGDPVLDGALVSFVCRLHAEHPGGDHKILVGEVERVEFGEDKSPLLYYRRDYHQTTF